MPERGLEGELISPDFARSAPLESEHSQRTPSASYAPPASSRILSRPGRNGPGFLQTTEKSGIPVATSDQSPPRCGDFTCTTHATLLRPFPGTSEHPQHARATRFRDPLLPPTRRPPETMPCSSASVSKEPATSSQTTKLCSRPTSSGANSHGQRAPTPPSTPCSCLYTREAGYGAPIGDGTRETASPPAPSGTRSARTRDALRRFSGAAPIDDSPSRDARAQPRACAALVTLQSAAGAARLE